MNFLLFRYLIINLKFSFMKENVILKDFVGGLEMTLLNEEDAVLLEGMVGTSSIVNNCDCIDNCPLN